MSSENARSDETSTQVTSTELQNVSVTDSDKLTTSKNCKVSQINLDATEENTQNIQGTHGLEPATFLNEVIDLQNTTKPSLTDDVRDKTKVFKGSLNKVEDQNYTTMQSMESNKFSGTTNENKNVKELSEGLSKQEILSSTAENERIRKDSSSATMPAMPCIEAPTDQTKHTNKEICSNSDNIKTTTSKLTNDEACKNFECENNLPHEIKNVSSSSDKNFQRALFSKLTEIPSEDSLDSIIPQKSQVGFRNIQVAITSIDSNDVFILFGTNAGCGFLYNRETGHLMKLACETRNDVVTTVKLFIGIECQCALGTADGKILIVIISSGSAPNTRRVQKFSLGTVHSTEVTCLEWSTSGMKLFSGDKRGNVHVIERDFERNQCCTSSLLTEENEVVDLSYKHKVLLVSTTERSLLFDTSLPDGQKILIGSKTRQGVYSACFGPDSSTASDLQIYCTRPGYRIWMADNKGKVTKTLLFKDLVASSHPEIKLTNTTEQVTQKDNQFRRLIFFQEKYLLTSSDSSILLIDPAVPSLLATCQNFDGLLNVSITRNEIFVLCKNRKIHRISEEQDVLAYRRRRLEEENMSEGMKKLQSMKNSISASFSLQALQSKMSSINEEAEQWSSKLQSQAKALQQRLPTIGSSLFSRDGKSESSDQHSEDIAMATTSNYVLSELSADETEMQKTRKDISVNHFKKVEQDSDERFEDPKPDSSPTSVYLHFEKMEEIGNQETNEIVFQSKRKRSKARSPSLRHHSTSDEAEKSPSKTTSQDSSQSPTTNDNISNSEDILNINGAHVTEESTTDVLTITIAPKTVAKQSIEMTAHKKSSDHHEQESVSHDSKLNNSEITISVTEATSLSHIPQDGDPESVESDQISSSTIIKINENIEKLSLESRTIDLELKRHEHIVFADPTHTQITLKENHDEPTTIGPSIEVTTTSQEIPLLEPTDTPIKAPVQEQFPHLNSEVTHVDCLSPNSNLTKLIPDKNTLNDSINASSCESADLTNDDRSLASSSDDIYAVDPATRDFESELDSEDDDSLKDTATDLASKSKEAAVLKTSVSRQQYEDKTSVPAKLCDSWSTTSLPHRVSSISASGNFIWFIDYYYQIYLAEEYFGDAAIKWKRFETTGTRLCVSPRGDIMWRLSKRGTVYAGVIPTELHLLEEPLNFYWKKVASKVSCIALGDGNAWVVTNDGVIKSQLDLTRSKFYAETWNLISWPQNYGKVLDIAVSKAMVWCRTDHNCLYRASIEEAHEVDAAWEKVLEPTESTSAILSLTSDGRDTIFVIDEKGVMSFLSEEGMLWQVNVSEFMDEEQHLIPKSLVQSLPQNFATSVHKMQRWMARPIEGQSIAVSNQSIWIIHGKYMAAVAKGPITGHRWDLLTPLGVSKSSKWGRITTSSIFSPDLGSWVGLVWASRPNGEIFCFSSQDVAKNHPVALPPATLQSTPIVCMSACKDALWVLYENGEIYIRSGVTASRLQGTEWSHLDNSEQLGDVKIAHISCGTQHVWAVGSEGQIFFRIGVAAVDRNSLPPAWIPVDECDVTGRHFTQIECGLSDSSIWAIDNYSEIYVRTGVSVDMPIGTKWEAVPGSHARQICISNHTVWGLRKSGNLIRRFGISQRNQMGNYWKKVIGRFIQIAVTPYDELWAIDEADHLRHLSTAVYCPIVVEAQYQHDDMDNCIGEDFSFPENVEKDWEIL